MVALALMAQMGDPEEVLRLVARARERCLRD